jgi:hypothetical protein
MHDMFIVTVMNDDDYWWFFEYYYIWKTLNIISIICTNHVDDENDDENDGAYH